MCRNEPKLRLFFKTNETQHQVRPLPTPPGLEVRLEVEACGLEETPTSPPGLPPPHNLQHLEDGPVLHLDLDLELELDLGLDLDPSSPPLLNRVW